MQLTGFIGKRHFIPFPFLIFKGATAPPVPYF